MVAAATLLWLISLMPIVDSYNQQVARSKANLINNLLGAFYPTDRRLDYVIVELDKAYVSAAHEGTASEGDAWPPRYDVQAEFFQDVVDIFQPRALFIDLLYNDLRDENFDAITDFLCDLGPDSCRRDSTAGSICPAGPTAGLAPSDTPAVIAFFVKPGQSSEGGNRLLRLVQSCPHLSFAWAEKRLSYANQGRYSLTGGNDIETAAVRLYRTLCESGRHVEPAQETCEAGLERLDALRVAGSDLSLFWGPARFEPFYAYDGMPCLDTPVSRRNEASSHNEPCPHAPSVKASRLEYGLNLPPASRLDQFDRPVVMIGTAMGDGMDVFTAPMRDLPTLSGVYLHAMAYDNLLTYAQDVKSTDVLFEHRVSSLPFPFSDVLSMLRLVLSILAGWILLQIDSFLHARYEEGGAGIPTLLFTELVRVSGFIVVWIAFSAFMWFVMNLGTEQWITTSFYGAIISLLARGFARHLYVHRRQGA